MNVEKKIFSFNKNKGFRTHPKTGSFPQYVIFGNLMFVLSP